MCISSALSQRVQTEPLLCGIWSSSWRVLSYVKKHEASKFPKSVRLVTSGVFFLSECDQSTSILVPGWCIFGQKISRMHLKQLFENVFSLVMMVLVSFRVLDLCSSTNLTLELMILGLGLGRDVFFFPDLGYDVKCRFSFSNSGLYIFLWPTTHSYHTFKIGKRDAYFRVRIFELNHRASLLGRATFSSVGQLKLKLYAMWLQCHWQCNQFLQE